MNNETCPSMSFNEHCFHHLTRFILNDREEKESNDVNILH